MTERRARDLRAYARGTQARLVLGAILLLFLIGDGLVWLLWGPEAGALAVVCSGVGLLPVVLIGIWLAIVGWVARRARDD
jgi:hypothetical protein